MTCDDLAAFLIEIAFLNISGRAASEVQVPTVAPFDSFSEDHSSRYFGTETALTLSLPH